MKQTNKHPRPPIDRLRELFDYDAETGLLVRRERPPEDFRSLRMWRIWIANNLGVPVGSPDPRGYIKVYPTIDGQRYGLLAHRVIWAIVYGEWPDEIDHRDGDHANNRLENLRDAARMENMQNMRPERGGRSMDRRGRPNPYCPEIWADGKRYYLGSFPTAEAARQAYLKAKQELHKFQPIPRK